MPDPTPLPIACDLGALPSRQRAREQALLAEFRSMFRDARETEQGYSVEVPADPLVLSRLGEFLALDIRGSFDAAVLEVWKASRPGEKKPRFHDLRKTGATRVESVSSKAVAKAFLGHADEDVTDSYIAPGIEEVRDAVNRAARAIDGGDTPPGVLVFRPKTAHQTAQRSRKQSRAAKEPEAATLADPLIQQVVTATIPLPAKVAELVDAQPGARGSPPNTDAGTCVSPQVP